jgi:predicted transcriptional regulator
MNDDAPDDGAKDQIAREREIIRGIELGLADVRAGRVVRHDEAMRRVREVIDRASRKTLD